MKAKVTSKPDLATIISRNLKALVAILEPISQQDLAVNIGIPTMVLNRAYRGESTPNADAIVKIAKFFGVSTDEVLGLKPLKLKNSNLRIAR
jgi:ribosome-binding protein aMBF1 (putative translation factor)